MSKQLTHIEVNNKLNKKEIIVITDAIRTPENVGMLFRIAEAFGVKKVILLGESPNLNNKKVLRTARSTIKNIEISFEETATKTLDYLKINKFHLIGLELTSQSISLPRFDSTKISKIALFVGAERFGINNELLQEMETCVHIDLFGKNSSINVINALGIALFELTK